MTPQQIALVQSTHAEVVKVGPAAAEVFYSNLFHLDPELKPMFRGDMHAQGRMLLQAIAFVVANLTAPDRLIPVVTALGQRHVAYGVTPAHYVTVGAALIATLSQALGDTFDADTRQAWCEAYGLLSTVMIEGAYPMQKSA